MELRPGYRQTEVGVIPEEWEVKRLREIATIATGNTPPTHDPANYGDEFLFVSPVDLGETKHVTTTEKKLSKKGFAISRRFPKDSILFVCIGSTIGKCGVASVDLTSNQQINAIFPSPAFSVDYLYYSVCTAAPKIRALAGEQAVPIVNKTQFSETAVVLPPLPEQRAIARALSDVDALIGALDHLITKKRDLKQAAMQQLLTGQKRLPGFHGEWEVKRLPEVCLFRGGKAHEQHISEFGRFVCVNSKFISTDGKVRKYSSTNFCPAKRNDILMVMSDLPNGRALAKAFLVEHDDLYAVNQRVCALTPYRDCSTYLFYILNRNPYFLKFDDGVSQTHLLNHVFRNCPLTIPATVAEQTAIAEVLSDMDAELEALEQRLNKTRALKQGMMQELLTGRTRLIWIRKR
jgi:type I restriction enzyme S subunit